MSLSNAQKGIIAKYRSAMGLGEFEYREILQLAAGVTSSTATQLTNADFEQIMREMEMRLNATIVSGRATPAEIFAKGITDPWRWHRQGKKSEPNRMREIQASDPMRRRMPKEGGKPATRGQVAKIRAFLHDLSHYDPGVKDWSYLAAMLAKSKKLRPAEIPTGWDTLDTIAARILIDILDARYAQAIRYADRAATAAQMNANESRIDDALEKSKIEYTPEGVAVDFTNPCPF